MVRVEGNYKLDTVLVRDKVVVVGIHGKDLH
jgi:hypothetical protein